MRFNWDRRALPRAPQLTDKPGALHEDTPQTTNMEPSTRSPHPTDKTGALHEDTPQTTNMEPSTRTLQPTDKPGDLYKDPPTITKRALQKPLFVTLSTSPPSLPPHSSQRGVNDLSFRFVWVSKIIEQVKNPPRANREKTQHTFIHAYSRPFPFSSSEISAPWNEVLHIPLWIANLHCGPEKMPPLPGRRPPVLLPGHPPSSRKSTSPTRK